MKALDRSIHLRSRTHLPCPNRLKNIRSRDSNVNCFQKHSFSGANHRFFCRPSVRNCTKGITDWSTQQPGVIVIDFDGTRMQVTSKPLGDNWYAAFRIARACYMKLRDGMSKAELRRKCQVYLQCMKIQLEQNYIELPLIKYLCRPPNSLNLW